MKVESIEWPGIAKEWDSIPEEAYKFIFGQVKDRYDEILSESTSLTDKSVKLFTLTIAGISAIAGYSMKIDLNYLVLAVLGILYILNLIFLALLMFPKEVILKGSPPKEIFTNCLDNTEYAPEDKIRIIYLNELKRYEGRIDFMNKANSDRHFYYKIVLVLTCVCILVTVSQIIIG